MVMQSGIMNGTEIWTYRTEDGYRLGSWVKDQRKAFENHKLTQEQFDLLSRCGMIWDVETGQANAMTAFKTHEVNQSELPQSKVG